MYLSVILSAIDSSYETIKTRGHRIPAFIPLYVVLELRLTTSAGFRVPRAGGPNICLVDIDNVDRIILTRNCRARNIRDGACTR